MKTWTTYCAECGNLLMRTTEEPKKTKPLGKRWCWDCRKLVVGEVREQ